MTLLPQILLYIFHRFHLIFSENTTTVRRELSSGEDETLADETNDSMDFDQNDRKESSWPGKLSCDVKSTRHNYAMTCIIFK